jgi:hypothetical protein
MLSFACDYKEAINDITGMQDMKLQDYKINNEEWRIVEQLHNILKVSHCLVINACLYLPFMTDFQGCYAILLLRWYT